MVKQESEKEKEAKALTLARQMRESERILSQLKVLSSRVERAADKVIEDNRGIAS